MADVASHRIVPAFRPLQHSSSAVFSPNMIFRIVSNVTCYLLPAYASYKALSSPYPVIAYDPQTGQATGIRSPTQAEQTRQVERWLMYWVVVGVVTGVESVAGWTISW